MAKADLQERAKELNIPIVDSDGKELTVAQLKDSISEKEKEVVEKVKPSEEENEEAVEETPNVERKEEKVESKKDKSFPKYHDPSVIQAVKIETIKRSMNGGATLNLVDGFGSIEVDNRYVQQYKPRAGGYFVTCDKGCKKYKSEDDFSKYVPIEEK
tara:strand:+ start:2970 stop:3440 length:471 start_codon:yes stop_codon:yes gene_type:complete